jgi:outer membrane protein TolC
VDPNALTLQQVVVLSLDKNPDRRIAASDVAAAQVSSRSARAALLPSLAFSQGATLGDDPVYAFSTKLRQQRFGQSDFALNNLNHPSTISNFTTRFSGNWTAFDSWRTEFQIRRFDLMLKSTQTATTRSDQEIVHRVVAGYEGVLFAARQIEVARHQVETANALLDASKSRVTAGTSVDSDQLSAAANLAERQQELIAAEGNLAIAWAELERAVGEPITEDERNLRTLSPKTFELPPLTYAVAEALRKRPDRESFQKQLEAERIGTKAARAAFGPTVSTFGSWETDRASFAGSGGSGWLAGAELRIDLLPAARRQELAAAKIAQERARAVAASADDQIRLEVTRAWYSEQSAGKMLEVAQASVAQSEESLRILRDRYDAGLATVSDLLRAEDAQRQSATNYWQAVFRNTLAWADLKFATGTLTPDHLKDLQ